MEPAVTAIGGRARVAEASDVDQGWGDNTAPFQSVELSAGGIRLGPAERLSATEAAAAEGLDEVGPVGNVTVEDGVFARNVVVVASQEVVLVGDLAADVGGSSDAIQRSGRIAGSGAGIGDRIERQSGRDGLLVSKGRLAKGVQTPGILQAGTLAIAVSPSNCRMPS